MPIMDTGHLVDSINFDEDDTVRLILEFLEKRELYASALALERETGVVNEKLPSDDATFLRQLILEGAWDDALAFAEPLIEDAPTFKSREFALTILKHKYLELLALRTEQTEVGSTAPSFSLMVNSTAPQATQNGPNQLEACLAAKIMRCLRRIRPLCVESGQYEEFCSLLDKFDDFSSARNRITCFRTVWPFVKPYLPSEELDFNNSLSPASVGSDRLVHLLIKGLLLERAVDWCHYKATGRPRPTPSPETILSGAPFGAADRSFLAWLKTGVPDNTFLAPFQQSPALLDVKVCKLTPPTKPSTLDLSWAPSSPFSNNSHFQATSPMDPPPRGDGRQQLGLSFGRFRRELWGTKKPVGCDIDNNTKAQQQQLTGPERGKEMTSSSLWKDYQMYSRSRERNALDRRATNFSVDSLVNGMDSLLASGGRESNHHAFQCKNGGALTKFWARNNMQQQHQHQAPPTRRNPNYPSNPDDVKLDQMPSFVPVTKLEDNQVVRAAAFHPNGKVYAVGSNTKILRICFCPDTSYVSPDQEPTQPHIIIKRSKHHKCSIYCIAWNPSGDIIATGSNDHTIKLLQFNPLTNIADERETELAIHDGTVRGLLFLQDSYNKSSLLVSAGSGDCKIKVTDVSTATPILTLEGHSSSVNSLYSCGGCTFVTGSQDRTIRFWDLRSPTCVHVASAATSTHPGSPVTAVCTDCTEKLMVAGHDDATVLLYDIRGRKTVQIFKPHMADVRSVSFSPNGAFLMTSSYDKTIRLSSVEGDLTKPLSTQVVAQHGDKVIQSHWHPRDLAFVSTSADKTTIYWAMPHSPQTSSPTNLNGH